ncbi:hypothetical protein QQ045_024262 [Rhodiola kirilowii]
MLVTCSAELVASGTFIKDHLLSMAVFRWKLPLTRVVSSPHITFFMRYYLFSKTAPVKRDCHAEVTRIQLNANCAWKLNFMKPFFAKSSFLKQWHIDKNQNHGMKRKRNLELKISLYIYSPN